MGGFKPPHSFSSVLKAGLRLLLARLALANEIIAFFVNPLSAAPGNVVELGIRELVALGFGERYQLLGGLHALPLSICFPAMCGV